MPSEQPTDIELTDLATITAHGGVICLYDYSDDDDRTRPPVDSHEHSDERCIAVIEPEDVPLWVRHLENARDSALTQRDDDE